MIEIILRFGKKVLIYVMFKRSDIKPVLIELIKNIKGDAKK